MAYETWRSLTGNGLTDAEAADLMLQLVTGIESRAAASRNKG